MLKYFCCLRRNLILIVLVIVCMIILSSCVEEKAKEPPFVVTKESEVKYEPDPILLLMESQLAYKDALKTINY